MYYRGAAFLLAYKLLTNIFHSVDGGRYTDNNKFILLSVYTWILLTELCIFNTIAALNFTTQIICIACSVHTFLTWSWLSLRNDYLFILFVHHILFFNFRVQLHSIKTVANTKPPYRHTYVISKVHMTIPCQGVVVLKLLHY